MTEGQQTVPDTPSARPGQHPDPGIHFSAVFVDRMLFSDIAASETRPESLQFSFGIERRAYGDLSVTEVTVSVRITPPPEVTSRFSLEAAITGRFKKLEGPGVMPLSDFAKTNAPALVMPFVRELVTNITSRTRHGPIILPPVNVVKLVAEQEAAGAGAKETR